MKNMRKRILSLMVVLMMSLSLVQPTAFAAGNESGENQEQGLNIQTVVVDNSAASTPDTTPSGTDTTPAPTPSDVGNVSEGQETSGGDEKTNDSDESAKPELLNPDGSINPDAVERPGQSETVTTKPGPATSPEDETDSTPPEGEQDTTPPAEDETDPAPPAGDQDTTPPAEDETDPAGNQESTDPKEPADSEEIEKPAEPEAPSNWKLFWNDETKSYELTYEIAEDAEGDQTVDLTKALELLTKYAQDTEKVTMPVEPGTKEYSDAYLEFSKVAISDNSLSTKENALQYLEAQGLNPEDDYTKQYAAYMVDLADNEWTLDQIRNHGPYYYLAVNMNGADEADAIKNLTKNRPTPPPRDIDKTSPEYQAYLKDLEAYNRQQNANILQPGDIRKFTIYLTSQSGHTYKYKDGSFILATPGFDENAGTITGFDGQKIPDQYTKAEQTYNISGGFAPILNLLAEKTGESLDEGPIRGISYNSSSLEDLLETVGKRYGTDVLNSITQELGITYSQSNKNYTFSNVRQGLSDYLVKYYSEKDGKTYKDLDDVFAHSSTAASDMSSTDNQGTMIKKKWTIEGEKILATYERDFQYNNFYQSLLSFIYGNVEDVADLLGSPTGINNSFHPEYGPKEWSSRLDKLGLDYSIALEQYMAHQQAWDKANEYFNQLLADGLSVKDAAGYAFAMAVNIDGKLTSNSWQLTKWGWYNSIQLEQMDFSFNLTKTDMETGEIIADSETGFAIWYNKDDGTKMYCQRDENGDYYFDTTEAFVTTTGGSLNIDFALLKDIVYYLQEVNAPDGYEKDPTVYLIMNQEDYDTLSENVKAQIEAETGGNHGFLDLTVSEDGLSVSTEFGNVKIVTPPDRPTPTPTPDPDPDPDPDEPDIPDPDVPLVPGPDPEEPPVDIPEEDPPLVDIPEEEPPLVDMPDLEVPLAPRPSTPTKPTPKPPVTTVEVDIPDEEVPLADVPNTGDDTGLWCALGLAAGAGLAYLFLEEKKRQNSAR